MVSNSRLAKLSTRIHSLKFGDTYYIDAHELNKEDEMLIVSYKNAKLSSALDQSIFKDSIFFSKIKNKFVIDPNGEKIGRIVDAIIHIDYRVSFILGGSYMEEILEDLGIIKDLDIFLPTNIITDKNNKGDFLAKYEKKYFKKKLSRLDMIWGVELDRFPGEKHHVFYKMKTQLVDFEKQMVWISKKVEVSTTAKQITFTNLSHKNDGELFINMHNEIFFTSPDPVRGLTKNELKVFDENSTFIAWYHKIPVGFIFLPIFISSDPTTKLFGKIEGSIAGIGVLSKYRGKKVALAIIRYAFNYLKEHNVEWVTSEVFEKNEPSRKMFENLGFEIYDHMVLGEQQGKK